MPRAAIATIGGIAAFLLYVAIILLVADWVRQTHWLAELAFFAVAGIAWVWPAKRLMAWAVR